MTETRPQYGQADNRQQRIEQFVNRIAFQKRWNNSYIDAAVLDVLDRLSDPENSAVLDAVVGIYGDKSAALFARNILERMEQKRRIE